MTQLPLLMNTRLLLCAAALAAVALTAGCSGGGSPARSPGGGAAAAAPSPSGDAAAVYAARSLAVGLRFAQCARDHGNADFPDPVVNDGGLTWPGVTKSAIEAAEVNCADVLRELATIPQVAAEPPSAGTRQHMRQFAECMRSHGAPDWPDPKADGTFPLLGTPYRGMARYSREPIPQQVMDARQACIQYEQEWRIAAS